MARNIDDILRDVDYILEKKASAKKEVNQTTSLEEDDVVKIANLLMSEDEHLARELGIQEKVASKAINSQEYSMEVKLASALVMAEVLNNFDKFQKIAAFEKQAQESGYAQVDIDKFIVEKFL